MKVSGINNNGSHRSNTSLGTVITFVKTLDFDRIPDSFNEKMYYTLGNDIVLEIPWYLGVPFAVGKEVSLEFKEGALKVTWVDDQNTSQTLQFHGMDGWYRIVV